MRKNQAIQAMREGKKVTHRYFLIDEWMTMEGDEILLEDGVRCSQDEFWRHRKDEVYLTDWSIWVDPENLEKEKLIGKMVSSKAEKNNTIDLNAYAIGLDEMYNELTKKS